MPDKGPSPIPTMPDINVCCNGVIKLLKNINPHKATGPDNIPPHFLNKFLEKLSTFMTFFFQMSLRYR